MSRRWALWNTLPQKRGTKNKSIQTACGRCAIYRPDGGAIFKDTDKDTKGLVPLVMRHGPF